MTIGVDALRDPVARAAVTGPPWVVVPRPHHRKPAAFKSISKYSKTTHRNLRGGDLYICAVSFSGRLLEPSCSFG